MITIINLYVHLFVYKKWKQQLIHMHISSFNCLFIQWFFHQSLDLFIQQFTPSLHSSNHPSPSNNFTSSLHSSNHPSIHPHLTTHLIPTFIKSSPILQFISYLPFLLPLFHPLIHIYPSDGWIHLLTHPPILPSISFILDFHHQLNHLPSSVHSLFHPFII